MREHVVQPSADGGFVRRPTFGRTKCCKMHEWLVRRAAPQHFEVVVNGS
jgi:hypothetical protein